MCGIATRIRRLERLLTLKDALASLRIKREIEARTAHRFPKTVNLKASSAEAILRTCLNRLKFSKKFKAKLLTGPQRLQLLQEIRQYGRAWLHHEAAAFLAENEPDSDTTSTRTLIGTVGHAARRLFGRMKIFVKELFVAGTMALVGPRALNDRELKAVDQQHQVQVAYFDRFENELGKQVQIINPNGTVVFVGPEPEQKLDGTFASRAELYGASVWGVAQEVARASAAQVFTVERRRHIKRDDPCGECVSQLAKGWQPIGTLIPIGDCECLNHCHCFFEYKVHPDDERVYYAGDEPDKGPDLGSTVIDV